ncbi:hypothetical protein [Flavobacterium fluviatile]|uniref:hypothetical protein n=1 Tax=Flavobacterium fluviatile TaxID=1862387 RepID=UPI0013D54CAD|nr:hypothetical protein [Flavobacterium fluviatile]
MRFPFYDLIDLKLTALYSFMLYLLNEQSLELFYKVICGIIFIGYNLNRWHIMRVEFKKRNKK